MKARAIHESKYGRTEVGPAYAGEGRSWRREDTWVPKDGGRAVVGTTSAAGPDDVTPHHMTYPTGYDPRCACCWLGHSHTEAVHARALREHGKCSDRDCYRCAS